MAALSAITGLFQYMLQGILGVGRVLFALPFRIHFIVLWLFSLLFLLFNAETIYEARATAQSFALLLYMGSLAFVFGQTRQRNPLLGISAAEFILIFVLWAAVGAFVFKALSPFTPAEHPPLTRVSIAILLTHALVVAIGEELLFRIALPGLIPGPRMAAQTISAIAFGVMHWQAYGGSVPNIVFAIVLGLFFGAITVRVRNGFVIACALHFAYNAYVLGFV